jgi:hypothetical protein
MQALKPKTQKNIKKKFFKGLSRAWPLGLQAFKKIFFVFFFLALFLKEKKF